MEILKIKQLEHSGIGNNAIHIKVIDKFRKSKEDGLKYCKLKGFDVSITDVLLTVKQNVMYGFKMSALITN